MFFRSTKVAVIMAVVLLVGSSLYAQERQRQRRGGFGFGGFGGGMGGGGKLMLLASEKLQAELDLDDDQKAELKKMHESMMADMRDMFSSFRDLSEADREKKMAESREKMAGYQKQVEEMLLPPQTERLEQLSIQRRGVEALADDKVAESIKLSESQRSEIKQIQEDLGKASQELFASFRQPGQDGGQDDNGEARQAAFQKMGELRQAAEQKTLGVLSDEQKQAFESLKGDKFEFEAPNFGPGGRGPGRRQRPGNGSQRNSA